MILSAGGMSCSGLTKGRYYVTKQYISISTLTNTWCSQRILASPVLGSTAYLSVAKPIGNSIASCSTIYIGCAVGQAGLLALIVLITTAHLKLWIRRRAVAATPVPYAFRNDVILVPEGPFGRQNFCSPAPFSWKTDASVYDVPALCYKG